jgi:hypothetical protein
MATDMSPSGGEIEVLQGSKRLRVEMADVQTFLDALASMNKALCSSPHRREPTHRAVSADGHSSDSEKDEDDEMEEMEDMDMHALPKKRGRKRLNLTEEEKLKKVSQVRERNREHAKRIRQKRKQYVEELKQEAAELVLRRHSTLMQRQSATEAHLKVNTLTVACVAVVCRAVTFVRRGIRA